MYIEIRSTASLMLRLAEIVGVNVHAHVLHVDIRRLAGRTLAERALLVHVLIVGKLLHRSRALIHLVVMVDHAAVFGAVEVVLLIVRRVRGCREGNAAILVQVSARCGRLERHVVRCLMRRALEVECAILCAVGQAHLALGALGNVETELSIRHRRVEIVLHRVPERKCHLLVE